MAIYLDIQKTSENGDAVSYLYRTTDNREGEFQINKISGEIRLKRLAPGDEEENLFRRAAHKITKHFREGRLPETTCWAS